MLDQLFFIIAVSLFDSFATTQQIVIFVLILTTANPLKNSISYLAGLITVYFACGLFGYLALDQLSAFVSALAPAHGGLSDTAYYRAQIFAGIVFAAIGVIYYAKKRNSKKPAMENILISRLKNMNAHVAFVIGAVISVTGFPLSLPYIAALGKFAFLKMNMPEVVASVLLYNISYALPMLAILIIYFFTGAAGRENMEGRLNERAAKLNLRLTSIMFVALGLLSIADSIVFFLTRHPIFKDRFF